MPVKPKKPSRVRRDQKREMPQPPVLRYVTAALVSPQAVRAWSPRPKRQGRGRAAT